jgi:uncharacterized membrane protein
MTPLTRSAPTQAQAHAAAGTAAGATADDASQPLVAPHTQPTVLEEDRITAWTRRFAVASLLGLIVLGLAWELFLAPTGQKTLALKVLPLTLPLAGFLKRRMYTYRWVSLFVWLYFIEGVMRAWGDVGVSRLLAGIEIVLCLALFAACLVHVRWRLARAKAAGLPLHPPAAQAATEHASAPQGRQT